MSRDLTPIFLFSLPRSGSTLLQRLLAAHDEVATASEPHLLLPLVYSLRTEGIYAEYNHKLASMAVEDFCGLLSRGRRDYFEEVRAFALALYRKAAGGEASYFLDKTPRYSLIADDVMRIFPDGKFLFLWRNPLAVLASVLEQSKQGRWQAYGAKVDLFKGLVNLVDACREKGAAACSVRYEDLLAGPEWQYKRLLHYLELEPASDGIPDFAGVDLTGRLGDKTGSRKYRTIASEPLDKWKRTLSNPLRKSWCRRYLRWLGKDRLAVMGYSLEGLLDEIDAIPTSLHKLLSDLVHMPLSFLYSFMEPRLMRDKLASVPLVNRIFVHY